MLAKHLGCAVVISFSAFISSNVLANEELRSALEAAVEQANQAQIADEIEKTVAKQEGGNTKAEKSASSPSIQNQLQNVVDKAVEDTPKAASGSVEGGSGAKGIANSEEVESKKSQVSEKTSSKKTESEIASTKKVSEKKNSATEKVSANARSSNKTSETTSVSRTARVERDTASPASRKPVQDVDNKKKSEGWMYIGRFFEENWTDKALKIDNKLPKSGEAYKVGISTNVRASYPGQQGMKKVVKVLDDRYQVEVIDVRRVGRDHHYWALVKWLR